MTSSSRGQRATPPWSTRCEAASEDRAPCVQALRGRWQGANALHRGAGAAQKPPPLVGLFQCVLALTHRPRACHPSPPLPSLSLPSLSFPAADQLPPERPGAARGAHQRGARRAAVHHRAPRRRVPHGQAAVPEAQGAHPPPDVQGANPGGPRRPGPGARAAAAAAAPNGHRLPHGARLWPRHGPRRGLCSCRAAAASAVARCEVQLPVPARSPPFSRRALAARSSQASRSRRTARTSWPSAM